jgi:hypothetical protein
MMSLEEVEVAVNALAKEPSKCLMEELDSVLRVAPKSLEYLGFYLSLSSLS